MHFAWGHFDSVRNFANLQCVQLVTDLKYLYVDLQPKCIMGYMQTAQSLIKRLNLTPLDKVR